jgi:hypothetical protein
MHSVWTAAFPEISVFISCEDSVIKLDQIVKEYEPEATRKASRVCKIECYKIPVKEQ